MNRELIELWMRARSDTTACPTYAEFNFKTLSRYTDTLMVLQPLPDGDFFYSYFGTSRDDALKADLTGHRHSELNHTIGTEIAHWMRTVLESGEPLLLIHGTIRSPAVHTWEHAILPVESPIGRILVVNMLPVIYKTDLIESIVQSSSSAILACAVRDEISNSIDSPKIVMANRAAQTLFERTGSTVVGLDVDRLIAPSDLPAFRSACAAVGTSGQPINLKLDLAEGLSDERQDLTISPFDGGVVLTFADLAALRRAYTDLRRREQELGEAKAELKHQEQALASLAEAIGRAQASYEQELNERRRLEAELRRLAETDELTGLLNRRAFFREMETEVKRTVRYGHPLSLLYLDIDHFKSINDTRGHAAGDAILRGVLQRIVSVLRKSVDLVGRLGGDEFAILLPETDLPGAERVGERVRQIISETAFTVGDQTIFVTLSIGVAAWETPGIDALSDQHVDDWVARADAGLYEAKKLGRNKVSTAARAGGTRPAAAN